MTMTNEQLSKMLKEELTDFKNQIVLLLDEDGDITTYNLCEYLTFEVVSSGLLIESNVYGSLIRSLSEIDTIIIINRDIVKCTRIDLFDE